MTAGGNKAIGSIASGTITVDVGALVGLTEQAFTAHLPGRPPLTAAAADHRLLVEDGHASGLSVTLRQMAPGARAPEDDAGLLRREFVSPGVTADGERKLFDAAGTDSAFVRGTLGHSPVAVAQFRQADSYGRHLTAAAVGQDAADIDTLIALFTAGTQAVAGVPAGRLALPFDLPVAPGARVREHVTVKVQNPLRPSDALLEWEASRNSAMDKTPLDRAAPSAFGLPVTPAGSRPATVAGTPGLAVAGIATGPKHRVAALSAAAQPAGRHVGVAVAREIPKGSEPFAHCLPYVSALSLWVAPAAPTAGPATGKTPEKLNVDTLKRSGTVDLSHLPPPPPPPAQGRDLIAIDFGTTFTAAVIRPAGREAQALSFPNGMNRISSAVFRDDTGTLIAGERAERQAALSPLAFEATPKRRAGEGTVSLGSVIVTDVELVAAVLRTVAEEFRLQRGGNIDADVWMTHPAEWRAPRQQVLLAAAVAAGLGNVSLVAEPVAAAGYYASRAAITEGASVAVYDLGGGTFDAAVVHRGADRLRLAGPPGGIDPLGGVDFDRLLFEHVGRSVGARDAAAWQNLLEPADPSSRANRRGLMVEVRTAKEALSEQASYTVIVPGSHLEIAVTLDELNGLIGPYIDKTVEILAQTIRAAGQTPQGLAAIYLVGGSSRIPLVAERIWQTLGVRPVTWDDPKLVTALGATAAAALISS